MLASTRSRTHEEPEFKVNEKVRCIDNSGVEGFVNFGGVYTIRQIVTRGGLYYIQITVGDIDSDSVEELYAARFEPLKGSTSPVIRKIRAMDAKRKSLGYRW